MKVLFTFENPLPSAEADAEVFLSTARHLAPLLSQAWLHVPLPSRTAAAAIQPSAGMPILRAIAPLRPAALRHVCCGLTLPLQRQFWAADLVYTRNLFVAAVAILARRRVAFDHYRPWPDQIPPLQFWLYRLIRNRNFLVNICHSDYTRQKYLALGLPPGKLVCIHNGFEPSRLHPPLATAEAKRALGIHPGQPTIVYTGRLNHKKGLGLVIHAARSLPGLLFLLVGSYGNGPIEALAANIPNLRLIPFQPPEALRNYIFAADILLIPPSSKPLAEFGSTVLPLKLFLYLAAGRPILAGDLPDVREVLTHRHNAILCQPDCPNALIAALRDLSADPAMAARLAATALAGSQAFTWAARAGKIAALLQSRLLAPTQPAAGWTRTHTRTWLHQSLRWLVHLLTSRSVVLPPLAKPETAPAHALATD